MDQEGEARGNFYYYRHFFPPCTQHTHTHTHTHRHSPYGNQECKKEMLYYYFYASSGKAGEWKMQKPSRKKEWWEDHPWRRKRKGERGREQITCDRNTVRKTWVGRKGGRRRSTFTRRLGSSFFFISVPRQAFLCMNNWFWKLVFSLSLSIEVEVGLGRIFIASTASSSPPSSPPPLFLLGGTGNSNIKCIVAVVAKHNWTLQVSPPICQLVCQFVPHTLLPPSFFI